MHHIEDFFCWLFALHNNGYLAAMFVLGCLFLAALVTAALFALSFWFGVVAVLSVLLGVPIFVYLLEKRGEEE